MRGGLRANRKHWLSGTSCSTYPWRTCGHRPRLVGRVRSVARIVVSGYMIRHPVAGNLLAYFHYLLGLHRLGHQVTYVEESGWASACYDPVTGNCGDDPGPGLRAVRTLLDAYGVTATACYVDQG